MQEGEGRITANATELGAASWSPCGRIAVPARELPVWNGGKKGAYSSLVCSVVSEIVKIEGAGVGGTYSAFGLD